MSETGERTGVAKAKEVELRWELLGDKPEVVITPRGQLDLTAARALASTLAKEKISALIWDRRSTGTSSIWAPLTEASLPEQEVEDLKILLDVVKPPKPIVLLGFSSGARLSALFAAKYPSRLSGLAILPTGDAGGAAALLAQAYYGDCREVAEEGGMASIVATPGSSFYALAKDEHKRKKLLAVDVKDFVNVMLNSQLFIESFTGEALLGLFPEELRHLRLPSLVLHHGLLDDRLHALEDAEAVAAQLGASLFIQEDLVAMHRAIVDFIRSVR